MPPVMKRNDRDAERLGGIDQLLSEYQKAIDALTRRAKAADAAFAGVCQVRTVDGGVGRRMIEDRALLPFIVSNRTYTLLQEPWVLGCAADEGSGAGATGGIDPAQLLEAALQDRRRGMCTFTCRVYHTHACVYSECVYMDMKAQHLTTQQTNTQKRWPYSQPPRWRWRCSGSRKR